jgi:hypothetical protein
MENNFFYPKNNVLKPKGGWDANSNSPELLDNGVGGVANDFYIVDTDGSTSVDGHSSWEVGDWIINTGTSWDRIPSSNTVVSVAGKNGIVTLVKEDVGLTNVDNTSDLNKPISTLTQSALDLKSNDLEVVHLAGEETITGIKKFSDNIVFTKTSGKGLLIDKDAPTYCWQDIIGYMLPDTGGANAPTLTAFRGGLTRRFSYGTNDKMDLEFHFPHDYAPGTDIYIHIHWGHNGTNISGNLIVNFSHSYAKGHNQEIFSSEKTLALTHNTVNISTTPRWIHRIDELQLSSNGGSATLLDSSLIEPDGILGVNMTVTTIPTITGGSPNAPFIFFSDIHYQSTNLSTKNKSPDFYA